MSEELQILSNDLLTFYAECFCKRNLSSARSQLDQQQNQMRRNDLLLIALFGGMILMLLPLAIFLLLIPPQMRPGDTTDNWEQLSSGIEIYYFGLLIVFIIAATGFAVQVFRKYGVNYMFIFEIDQHYKLIHHQLYRLALIFGFIWFFCLVWQLLQLKLNSVFPSDFPIFTVILIVSFVVICCVPCHMCYLKGRKEIAKALYHILISPFGLVRFRHFFLADIVTSMTSCLENTGTIGCYFVSGNVTTSQEVENLKEECVWLFNWKILVSFLPYWWRFA